MLNINPVKICNMALSHVGTTSNIESLDEASSEANICKLWYHWSKIQVLEAHNWNFSRRRIFLPVIEMNPNTDWIYRYEYPSDCVKARMIENPAGPSEDTIPFTIETTNDGVRLSILTNQEQANLIYTFDIENTALFSSLFIDALSWRIAAQIAYRITEKRAIEDSAIRMFQGIVALAMAGNSAEGINKPQRESEFIRVRS